MIDILSIVDMVMPHPRDELKKAAVDVKKKLDDLSLLIMDPKERQALIHDLEKMKQSFEKKIKKMDDKEDKKDALTELLNDITTLLQGRGFTNDQLAALVMSINSINSAMNWAQLKEDERIKTKRLGEENEEKLKLLEAALKNKREEMEKEKALSLKLLKEYFALLDQKYAVVYNHHRNLKQTKANVNIQLVKVASRLKVVNQMIQLAQDEYNDLTNKVKENKEELQRKTVEYQDQIQVLQRRREELTGQKAVLQEQQRAIQQDRQNGKPVEPAHVDETTEKFKELLTVSAAVDEEFSAAEARYKQTVESLTDTQRELEASAKEALAELSTLQEQKRELQDEQTELKTQSEGLALAIAESKEEIDSVIQEAQKTIEKLEPGSNERITFERELEKKRLIEIRDDAELQVKLKEGALEALDGEISEYKTELEILIKERDQMTRGEDDRKLKMLQSTIEKMQTLVDEGEESKVKAQREVQAAREALENASHEVDNFDNPLGHQIEGLREALTDLSASTGSSEASPILQSRNLSNEHRNTTRAPTPTEIKPSAPSPDDTDETAHSKDNQRRQ